MELQPERAQIVDPVGAGKHDAGTHERGSVRCLSKPVKARDQCSDMRPHARPSEPMSRLVPALVIAVGSAGVVLVGIAQGTDSSTGRYGLTQTIALVLGFVVFTGAVRSVIGTVRGPEA